MKFLYKKGVFHFPAWWRRRLWPAATAPKKTMVVVLYAEREERE